ncbi:hypothetical protein OQH61_07065 [Helicobacter sp. MIT 21-1697]|uniref:hypothetical protein n=1 Tax=Helicobacter sp. MIT 21-1697 TaxID=2993733 RepID=UPI00224A89CF|nr:hypothetical protein [Helicobacter sp. MIT 21-1697]MCX2717490.1 hypothetical protein [Helicobacter sp. MIT 21-1697]
MGIKAFLKQSTFYQNHFRPWLQVYRAKKQSAMSDEDYFTKRYKNIFGYKPNFKNPRTFNEKIIHRILFDRNPIYTALADKLKARIYIAHTLLDSTNNIGGGGV